MVEPPLPVMVRVSWGLSQGTGFKGGWYETEKVLRGL